MIDWHDMTAYDDGLQTVCSVEVGPALEVRHMHNILGNPLQSGTQFRKLLAKLCTPRSGSRRLRIRTCVKFPTRKVSDDKRNSPKRPTNLSKRLHMGTSEVKSTYIMVNSLMTTVEP